MKRVGILGGSFDPIHNGHLYIAKSVKKQLGLNEIWFMPTFHSPFKDRHQASFLDRINMIKRAIKPYSYMKLSTLEEKLPAPSYTINTVLLLKQKYPKFKFYWIMGDDQLKDFNLWHQSEKLVTLIDFVVVSREKEKLNTDFIKVEIKPYPAASSLIREGNFKYLPKSVNEYINNNVLYYKDFIKEAMSEKRYLHTLEVADFAVKLANKYQVSINKAFLAAYLHDYAKELPTEILSLYMNHYHPELLKQPKSLWHGYVGKILAQKKFNINDQDILLAIKHHTDGNSKKILSLIIYCADKVESSRPYDVKELQALCLKDIYQGKKVIEEIVLEKVKEKKS